MTSEYHHVDEVVIDAKVVLQIIKHAQDDSRSSPNCLDGFLTGFSDGGITELTHSFRSLSADDSHNDDEFFKLSCQYQDNMLRRLRDQNQDHILVGFYRKVSNFNFMTKPDDLLNILDFQLVNDKANTNGTVMIVYDHVRMSSGDFGLRAYRVSEKAIKMYEKTKKKTTKNQKNPFAVSFIQDAKLTFDELLEEVPISIKSSYLMNCMLHQIETCRIADMSRNVKGSLFTLGKRDSKLTNPAYSVACNKNLQNQTESLKTCVEEASNDTHKFLMLQRNLHNATIKKHQIIAAKERENADLVTKGEKAKNIDIDEIEKMVKMPEEHNRLGGMVHAYQGTVFSESVKNLSAGNMGKLFLSEKVTQ